jgi:hypothetical protein
VLAFVLLLDCLAGCGGSGRASYERYIPSADKAHQALDAALQDWQAGKAPGRIAAHAPPLQVVDSRRRPGQRLASYAILGEAPGDGPRCFAVRLKLENPSEELKARYVVYGIQPLWVMRHEDYDMMIHWECRPSETATEVIRRAGGR